MVTLFVSAVNVAADGGSAKAAGKAGLPCDELIDLSELLFQSGDSGLEFGEALHFGSSLVRR